jgi:hypothetical protein
MTESAKPKNDDRTADSKINPASPRLGVLLTLTVGLVIIGVGGVYWWTFAGGEKWFQEFRLPPKAAFRGTVTLDGKPLQGGQLTAWPDQAGVPRAVGFIEQNGEFILRIDVGGAFREEAFVGRHRVSVTQFEKQQGPSPPRMTSPVKYSSPDTSGLVIVVDRDPAKNVAELNLVSESPAPGDSKTKTESGESP